VFSMHDSIKLAITSLNGDLLNCQSLQNTTPLQSDRHLFPYDYFPNCLSFRSTWVHPWFLVGFVLLDLSFICMFLYVFCHCVVCSSIYGFWLPLLGYLPLNDNVGKIGERMRRFTFDQTEKDHIISQKWKTIYRWTVQ
jgi:hypothetical protein